LGLVASLRDLCEQFSERNPSIALKFTGEVLPAVVPREASSCLYRVTQEALQNIAKHSDAKHVSVALCCQKGSVLLSLEDDGVGFDPEVVRGEGGLGLISMRERAHLVKGKLAITSQPGHGTQLTLSIPL
jgi:signal transduction histidine kinase